MPIHQLVARRTIALGVALVTVASTFIVGAVAPTRGSPLLNEHIVGQTATDPSVGVLLSQTQQSSAVGPNVPTVLETLFPNYNGSLPGNFPSTVANWQVGVPALVPSLGELWLPQLPVSTHGLPIPESAPTEIYDIATNSFLGFVPQLSNVAALVFDPSNGYLYGADPSNSTVEVFDPIHEVQVGRSIPVGRCPDAIVFDPTSQFVFTANWGSNNVTVINAVSNSIQYRGVDVASRPVALADDYKDSLIYVASGNESTLSILNAIQPTDVEPAITLAFGPASSLAYSGAAGIVAATIPESQNATVIDARGEAVLSGLVAVGTGASVVAVNQNGSTFVMANGSGTDLTLVNSSTFAVAPLRIPVADLPSQLTGAPQSGQVLVWSAASRVLTLVDLKTETSTTTSVSLNPVLGPSAFNNVTGVLFATDSTAPGIDVVNATTGKNELPRIALTSAATGLVDLPSAHRLFIGMNNEIIVLNDTTGRVISQNESLPGANGPMAVDTNRGILWVGRPGSDLLLGLNATTLVGQAVTPVVSVNPLNPNSLSIDPATNEIFALNISDSGIGVFNATNGHRISPDLHLGTNVSALAFDTDDGLIYSAGTSLTAINPTTLQTAGDPILLPTHSSVGGLSFDPERGILFVATTNASGAGTLSEIPGTSYSAGASSVTSVSVGRKPGTPLASGEQPGELPDSSLAFVDNSGSGTISLIGDAPTISQFEFSPATIDENGTTVATVTAAGGAGASTTSYVGLPRGCTSEDSLSLQCVPNATGTFVVTVSVTDSLGDEASSVATLVVGAKLSLDATFGQHSQTETDIGLSFAVSAAAHGGIGAYTYSWEFGDGSTSTGATAQHTYTSTGDYVVRVTASDGVGGTATVFQAIEVWPTPTVTVQVLPLTTVDAGVTVTLIATVMAGSNPGRGSWSFDDGQTATGLTTTHHWSTGSGAPTSYPVNFSYEDAAGAYANKTVIIQVDPALAGTFSVNSGSTSTIAPDALIRFAASPTGGTSPYNATWTFGDGTESTGLSVTHQYASPGMYVVSVVETDSGGGSVSSTLTVQVVSAPSATPSLYSGNFGPGLVVGLVVGGAGAALALFFAERSRRKPAVQPPSPYVPPRPRPGVRRP
jgi:DNA-binding beta-propeller fold protein YncE/PKD repeat protein